MLVEQLTDLGEAGFDLNLVGFDSAALDLLFAATSEESDGNDWTGMPAFSQADKRPFRSLIVNFQNQDAIDVFAALIEQRITDKTRYCWYPEQETDPSEKRYEGALQ